MAIKDYNIVLTDTAKIELEEIYKYIFETLLEPNSANKIMEKIENEMLRLEQFLYSCVEVTIKPHSKVYRKLVIGNYVVLYKVYEKYEQVVIYHILYDKRDYLK